MNLLQSPSARTPTEQLKPRDVKMKLLTKLRVTSLLFTDIVDGDVILKHRFLVSKIYVIAGVNLDHVNSNHEKQRIKEVLTLFQFHFRCKWNWPTVPRQQLSSWFLACIVQEPVNYTDCFIKRDFSHSLWRWYK